MLDSFTVFTNNTVAAVFLFIVSIISMVMIKKMEKRTSTTFGVAGSVAHVSLLMVSTVSMSTLCFSVYAIGSSLIA
ncbi:hypothetical protein ACL69T_004450 [Salmonella enterica]|uniref:hypothetical protein n=1 Tax=Klebsiella pneumoniae TaxID=573 RepID=UPI0012F0FC54|nr:hypothetical protein [Salmonella enterica subsp. enterica serovar Senftenberg]